MARTLKLFKLEQITTLFKISGIGGTTNYWSQQFDVCPHCGQETVIRNGAFERVSVHIINDEMTFYPDWLPSLDGPLLVPKVLDDLRAAEITGFVSHRPASLCLQSPELKLPGDIPDYSLLEVPSWVQPDLRVFEEPKGSFCPSCHAWNTFAHEDRFLSVKPRVYDLTTWDGADFCKDGSSALFATRDVVDLGRLRQWRCFRAIPCTPEDLFYTTKLDISRPDWFDRYVAEARVKYADYLVDGGEPVFVSSPSGAPAFSTASLREGRDVLGQTASRSPLWVERKRALEGCFGAAGAEVFGTERRWEEGGGADVLVFPNWKPPGEAYVTAGLSGQDLGQLPNNLGLYELMIASNERNTGLAEWLSYLARHTCMHRVEVNEVMKLRDGIEGGALAALLFTTPAIEPVHFDLLGERYGVLLAIGITAEEHEFMKKTSAEELLMLLTAAKVFPFTIPGRSSVWLPEIKEPVKLPPTWYQKAWDALLAFSVDSINAVYGAFIRWKERRTNGNDSR